jgi:SsrA-binding protein
MMMKKKFDEKMIATNPLARTDYFIDEVLEAGLVLKGTEIKSLREKAAQLRDSFVEIEKKKSSFEAWMVNAHIAPYSHGNVWNHGALRKRKLLLHRHQLERLYGAITQKGVSIIPMRLYLKKGFLKVELGVGKGKKAYDKRQVLKKKAAEHEMQVALKQSNREKF